ncbi:hypothetical protein C0991_004577, partial [Blastosporella zonata]
WLSLAEYEASGINPTTQTVISYSYQDWKTAVISLYPGVDNATKYSMANLDQVTGEAGRADIKTIGQFAAYYRKFYQITKWLVDSGRLGSLERDCLFWTGLSNKLWTTMQHCLNIVERDIQPGDPYTMAQMKAAAKFVLHGTNTTILNTAYALQVPRMFICRDNQPFGSSLSLLSCHIPVLPPVPKIKKEEYKQKIAKMDMKLEAVLASLQKLTSGNNNSIGRGKCAFCGRMGYTVHNCYKVERYINSGCVLQRDNHLCLPSCATLPNPTIPGLTLMVSANGQTDATLGLAKNIPVVIGNMTFVLQFHVIRNPSYKVLLGRPFDVLARSEVKTQNKEQTVITITDPNTGEVLTVPTFPRDRPKGQKAEQDF